MVSSPWFHGRTSVAITEMFLPCSLASRIPARAALELQCVITVMPSLMRAAQISAIRCRASADERMNRSARVFTRARASASVFASDTPCSTRRTALGRETAVGRVDSRRSAAAFISETNASSPASGRVSAWSRSAAAASRAIFPAPRISMVFICSAVFARDIRM